MADGNKYTDAEITGKLAEHGLRAWYHEDGSLRRKFATDGWPLTLLLVNAIGYLAEAAYHHPDLALTWGKVWVRLKTHSVGGITDKDFALAKKIEDVVLRRLPVIGPVHLSLTQPDETVLEVSSMSKRPGGPLAALPLHFIWIADCSGSMAGDKIQTLNFAIRETLPEMKRAAEDNPHAQILIRAVKFSNGAQWHVTSQPTDIKDYQWTDLTADGETDMGLAMKEVAKALQGSQMEEQGLPPVLVLVSDGRPTDDFRAGLGVLLQERWAQKAVRIAIAIGEDAHLETLQKFIGHNELKPLVAKTAPALVRHIRWVATTLVPVVSAPPSQPKGAAGSSLNVPIPTQPANAEPGDGEAVW